MYLLNLIVEPPEEENFLHSQVPSTALISLFLFKKLFWNFSNLRVFSFEGSKVRQTNIKSYLFALQH